MYDLIKKGYLGNPDQLASVRLVIVAEGPAKGADVIEVRTAGGLALDVLPDTGLDLGQCSYKGVNMSWMSKNGYDSPAVIGHYENEYNNHFPGGLLYTCGLRNAGPPNRDEGEWHPVHGRFHSLAATQLKNPAAGVQMTLSWSGDTLPMLSQWRSMGSGDYVLGLEPCNTSLQGRQVERANGTAKILMPYESITNTVKFEFGEA